MSLKSVQSELTAVGQRLSGSFTTVEDRQRTLAKQRSLEIKFWIEQKKAYPRDSGSTKTAMSTLMKNTWKTVKGSRVADIIRKSPYKAGIGAFLTGGATLALATRPDYRSTGIIPGRDDAYNTLEGLPHGGLGQDMRRNLTEFGSGWRGMFTSVAGTAAVGTAAYAGLGYATRVPKHELIGMSYLGMSEEDLYAALTKPRHSQWDFTSVFRPHEERESAATVGTAFHEYLETLKMAEGGNVEEIERHVYSRKHGLSGYADVIYDDNTVSDIKSVGRDVFQQIKSRNAPVQKHFDQVNAYAVLNESRKGRIEYHLRSDPSQKMVYEWESDEENFKNTMAKVNRVRQRISTEIAAGTLKESDLQMKKSLEFERVSNIFVRNPFSFDVSGTSEALQGFITKRETFYNDRRNSTFEQLENFNTSMMDGNKTEHMFKAAKDGGRRHQRMGYA